MRKVIIAGSGLSALAELIAADNRKDMAPARYISKKEAVESFPVPEQKPMNKREDKKFKLKGIRP